MKRAAEKEEGSYWNITEKRFAAVQLQSCGTVAINT